MKRHVIGNRKLKKGTNKIFFHYLSCKRIYLNWHMPLFKIIRLFVFNVPSFYVKRYDTITFIFKTYPTGRVVPFQHKKKSGVSPLDFPNI